jgi:peroxiredoxin
MTIAVGDRIPDVQLKMVTDHGTETVSTADVLGKGRVVLFGVPAAFSPTCSDVHLPGFVLHADEITSRGVDGIFCVSVNDPFVMAAWARSQGVGDKVTLLADGNGDLARAMGVDRARGRNRPGGQFGRSRLVRPVGPEGQPAHLVVATSRTVGGGAPSGIPPPEECGR